MKLKVSQLVPNPFRNLAHYPIDKKKLATLEKSIKETSFWDNILARPTPTEKGKKKSNTYQISYGHHRLKALQQAMPNGTIDIPVRNLSDVEMLRIMANENAEEWGGSLEADLETIKTVRQYLIEHKEIWKNLIKVSGVRKQDDIDPETPIEQTAHYPSPGPQAISEFLGGIWSRSKVYKVLRVLVPVEKGEIDEDIVRTIPTTTEGVRFVESMRRQPIASQRRVAARIAKGEVNTSGVKQAAREELARTAKERRKVELYEYVSNAYSALQRAHSVFIEFHGKRRQIEETDIDLTALQMVSIQVYQVLGRWLNLPVEGPDAATEVGPLSAPADPLTTAKALHEAAKTDRRQKRTAAKSNIIDIPSTTLVRVK